MEKVAEQRTDPADAFQQFVRVSVQQSVDNSFSQVFGNVDKVEMYIDTTTGPALSPSR